LSLDDILLGLSVPRNEKLANIFYRLHLIEAYGTGIPKIMRSYAQCAKKPKLQATSTAFKITLPNRNASKGNGSITSFSEDEEKIIGLFDKQVEITRNDVETALRVSQAKAVRLLRGLIDKNVIRVIDGGKKTRYSKLNV
jgi:ATP-dependent DNA helicase RecG